MHYARLQRRRQLPLVPRDCRKSELDPIPAGAAGRSVQHANGNSFEVRDHGLHARNVLVRVRPRLELVRRHVRNEILTKGGQAIDRLATAPGEP